MNVHLLYRWGLTRSYPFSAINGIRTPQLRTISRRTTELVHCFSKRTPDGLTHVQWNSNENSPPPFFLSGVWGGFLLSLLFLLFPLGPVSSVIDRGCREMKGPEQKGKEIHVQFLFYILNCWSINSELLACLCMSAASFCTILFKGKFSNGIDFLFFAVKGALLCTVRCKYTVLLTCQARCWFLGSVVYRIWIWILSDPELFGKIEFRSGAGIFNNISDPASCLDTRPGLALLYWKFVQIQFNAKKLLFPWKSLEKLCRSSWCMSKIFRSFAWPRFGAGSKMDSDVNGNSDPNPEYVISAVPVYNTAHHWLFRTFL